MKYIDADLLRAAIKEHTLFYAGQANLLDGTNTLDGYDEVLAIIDSLQQEQPEVDIEKEIDKLWESLNTGHPYVIVDSYQDFLGICLHCFELGLKARKED